MTNQGTSEGPSVAEHLAGQIADAIMVGEYPLGTWLRQEQLAQRFGVSRQPIREAMRRLEVIGMIEARPRRGVRVKGPDPGYIREGYLIRAELEGLAARLAAARRSPEQLEDLQRAWSSFRTTITRAFADDSRVDARAAWVCDHNQFHELIHEASGADRLAQLIGALNLTLPRNLSIEALRVGGTLAENLRQHELVLAAIELRSEQVAEAAMKEHIRRSGELIADWFARQQEALADG
ncbi:MAG: GntR family transcriptional regulator [Streptosporangiaceae bacterium]